ncbi:sulfite exporter TauE/SafE family protein [Desertivirga brevis]|uniref:sulfite exporter TauE/SafE family protein n=1 Tax=Desertivirga brevis TaxID=2810310 RepID=UPI001A958E8B|nr:sulfite exporter TauE/SafE family protein [Pedobacter sp. SYSU D00873]
MQLLGYFASALIGISLGLVGGGGSILTVPVMVYIFGVHPLLATSYSLFIVGFTSLVGSVNNFSKGLISLKAALFFGAASVITVFGTRKFLVPVIPKKITSISGFTVTESFLTMILFAILMLVASISMIREARDKEPDEEFSGRFKSLKLLGYGVGVGLVTGLLGAGGGFLLIPALVFLIKLPMKKAVGTSLAIIALNSLFGFAGDLGHFTINWTFLLSITIIAVAGIFIGSFLSKKIQGEKLKKGFGWFVLTMGFYILFKELSS